MRSRGVCTMSFLSLLKMAFLGMSTASFVLIIFLASSYCFPHSKVHWYSNQSEAVNMSSTDEINARSVSAPSPSIHLKHKGRFHMVQTVNQPPINTVSEPDDVMSPDSEGIYFSIKTTQKNHSTRLSILILTWIQTVLPSQVHIITDVTEPESDDKWIGLAKKRGITVVSTGCSPGHNPWSLCCKSGHEFDSYYAARRQYKWFCHFDDDVYVNVPMLATALRTFHPSESIYIGRWADRGKWNTVHRRTVSRLFPHYHRINFRFAVGAGYCISDALMSQLESYLRGSLFLTYCSEFKMVDSMLLGVIIESVLGYTLVNDSRFNSHYNLQNYSLAELEEQVTISYMLGQKRNTIALPDATFSEQEDPTRLLSLHCHLYADTKLCKHQDIHR